MRNLIVKRKKTFVACLVKVNLVIDGSTPVQKNYLLKNGEKIIVPLDEYPHVLAAYFTVGSGYSNVVNVPAGEGDRAYLISPHMGAFDCPLFLEEISPDDKILQK